MRAQDKDKDGSISFADYQASVADDPLLLEVFGNCLPEPAVSVRAGTALRAAGLPHVCHAGRTVRMCVVCLQPHPFAFVPLCLRACTLQKAEAFMSPSFTL